MRSFNIHKANVIHNNKYNYSNVVYTGVHDKIEIICPVHGPFFQTPKNHLYARAGCRMCSNDRTRGTFDYHTADLQHDSWYDYSRVIYKNVDTKVEIICPSHGSFFQTPDKHIKIGTGCPGCKIDKFVGRRKLTLEQFLIQAREVHCELYDYTLVDEIKNSHTYIPIICRKHGIFYQTPTNHTWSKCGCPKCASSVSRSGTNWLTTFNNPNIIQEYVLILHNKTYKVDGFDPVTNTVYEYFGVFWHGCPKYTDHVKVNPRNKVPYKILYEKTVSRINAIIDAGYKLEYAWGK